MVSPGPLTLAFGIPGLREVVLIALVALALYGRGGSRLLMATRYGRSLQPWMRIAGLAPRGPGAAPSPSGRKTATQAVSRRHGRLFWALTLLAAVALAGLLATRIVVLNNLSNP